MTSIATILNSNSEHAKILDLAGNIGKEMNMPTYVVGGYIRDLLINKKTNDSSKKRNRKERYITCTW